MWYWSGIMFKQFQFLFTSKSVSFETSGNIYMLLSPTKPYINMKNAICRSVSTLHNSYGFDWRYLYIELLASAMSEVHERTLVRNCWVKWQLGKRNHGWEAYIRMDSYSKVMWMNWLIPTTTRQMFLADICKMVSPGKPVETINVLGTYWIDEGANWFRSAQFSSIWLGSAEVKLWSAQTFAFAC